MFSYVVRCVFDHADAKEGFLAWLRDHHVADVCTSGAEDAEIVTLDATAEIPHALEIRYRFASRDSFERYEREHAPWLRAEGLAEAARLGASPGRGITMTRSTGESVAWRT
jgi:hypothetical protein